MSQRNNHVSRIKTCQGKLGRTNRKTNKYPFQYAVVHTDVCANIAMGLSHACGVFFSLPTPKIC